MQTRVIDAHTHLFSPDVIRRREHFVSRDVWFGHLYENPAARLSAVEDIVDSMESAGVDTSIVCGFPWGDPGLCREQNDFVAEACRLSPERLAFMGIVVPDDPGAAAEAERCFDLGAVGIGELNADAQGFDLDLPSTMHDLMAVCRERGRPVMLHASEPLGHDYPGKGTATPDRLVRWLADYSNQSVVLAHWGGGLPFYELMPEVHAVTRHVSYDSAASTYLYRQDVFRHVVNLTGPERVLFASDFPVLRQDRLLRRVQRQFADDAFLDDLLAGNAARVYRLNDRSRSLS
jgi:uncharacterized protein